MQSSIMITTIYLAQGRPYTLNISKCQNWENAFSVKLKPKFLNA